MFTSSLLVTTLSGFAWLPIVDAIAKASILFAGAALASVVLRRASAATRHFVWTLALVGALVLPLLSLALPRWQVPVVTLATAPAIDGVLPDAVQAPVAPLPRGLHREPGKTPTTATESTSAPLALAARAATALSWPSLILLIWGIGVVAVLGRIVAGVIAVHWISRRTEAADLAPWLTLAQSLATGLGVSSRIRFLRSRRASMPMAWGLVRPVVLMPADADAWPADRLRIVLLHELAHVKRRDCLTHLLAQIACAFHWFNPLAWMAARHVRTERERACDDLVLASGTRGPDYADQLLEIARVMRSERFPAVLAGASLAMAHRSQLEGRLMAILDPSVPRSGMSRLRTTVAATAAACALLPLASMQAWTFAAQRVPSAEEAAPMQASQTPASAPAPAPAPAAIASVTPPVASTASAVEADQRPRRRDANRGADSDLDLVSTVVNSLVNTLVDTQVNTQVNTHVNTHVAADINTAVSGNVTAHVSGHASAGGQDNKSKAADPRMVAALTAALKDIDKDVRETALHALVQLRDPSIFEPLVQALRDAAADVREQAAFGLGQLRDKRAVDPLSAALKDAAPDVREQAAFALGQIRDRSAADALMGALKDTSDSVREQVVFALGQLRDGAAVAGLTIALHDTKSDVREQAAFALGQIRDPRAVEPLISALKDPSPDVREQAAFALGQIRDRGAVEALVIALKDSREDVREQAAFALGQIRDPRAIDGLTAALKDPSADVRQQAAFALGQLARSR